MHVWEGRGSAHSHQIFHGAIWVVETGSHSPLNFLARETHIDDAVNCGRESGAGQETAARSAGCGGLGRLFRRRLNRLRSGFGGGGLVGLSWLDRLRGLGWLCRSDSACRRSWCGFSLQIDPDKLLSTR